MKTITFYFKLMESRRLQEKWVIAAFVDNCKKIVAGCYAVHSKDSVWVGMFDNN